MLEHTADIGIRAHGESAAEVFENAALGMFTLVTEVDKVREKRQIEIDVAAEDRETLLVEWLNELLYHLEVNEILFKRFQIEELSETHLKAKVFGEEIDLSRHPMKLLIKACTYHQLKVEKTDHHWVAQVIFDI